MKFGLRHIRYFIAVAEEQHFRKAAERLHIAQPALSRAIQHLERELDVVLLERNNRSVRITDAGETFLVGCRALLAGMESAIEDTKQVDAGKVGTLRIGYTDFAIEGALPGLLKQFQKGNPGIALRPVHGVTNQQLHGLEKGELDFGFVTGPVNPLLYNAITVQREAFCCVVYEGHPLASRRSIRLEELADETFVHGPSKDWEYFYYHFIPLCRRAGFMPRIEQKAYNSAAILGLVSSQMGITVLTETTRNTQRPGLVYLPFEDLEAELSTMAIWKPDRVSKAAKRFIKFLSHSCALSVLTNKAQE